MVSKPDGFSGCSKDKESGMDAQFFDKEQLLDLENNDVREEEDAEYVELEGIDVVIWEKKNGLWVVRQEKGLEGLRQHHNRQVAGRWEKCRTQELVPRDFIWDN